MKNKMRIGLLVAGVVGFCNIAFAQTVEQGKKFLYYQRYKSANEVFDKILAANPNNIEAIYWKGQTLFALHDSTTACDVYSKALQTNGNAPLLLVGMGGCELRMGKTADAKQRFETAISLTKGKDVNVLNAIADNNIDARSGDAQYAIEKLTQATQLKNFNSAETFVLMGDAYRKLIDGGNAVQSYQKALTIDTKLAEAKYKIGKIYETQHNTEFFLPAYQDAIQMDPNYAPAYYALHLYYFDHGDVEKTTEYLNKYIAVTDQTPELEYLRTTLVFLAKKYDEAIDAAKKAIQTLGDKVYPKYYLLAAYSYDAKGDSVNAREYLNQYFAKQKPEALSAADYAFQGKVLTKFASDSATAITAYQKAIDMDTVQADKQKFLKEAADAAKASGKKAAYAYWLGQAYQLNKNPNQNDIYNWGFANYSAGNYKMADSIFCGIYETKWPDEIFGYLWCKNARVAQDDSVGSHGFAVDAYDKLAAIARKIDSINKATGSPDSVKYRGQAVSSYFALAQYYNDIKKDKGMAVAYLQKVLEVDPTNPNAPKFIDLLTRKPAARPAGGAKPKAGGAK